MTGGEAGAGRVAESGPAHLAGRVLTGASSALGRVRRAAKPLHARGAPSAGEIVRIGLSQPLGVPWLDEPGRDSVTVRFSRGIGLPAPLPDVLGLAIRVPLADGGHADLLLSSVAGTGRVTRYLLAPARNYEHATYSTILPFDSPAGSVLILATPSEDAPGRQFELRAATADGPARPFGQLGAAEARDATARGADADIAFDPITNPLPGLTAKRWHEQLREGAYRAARRSRGDRRTRP